MNDQSPVGRIRWGIARLNRGDRLLGLVSAWLLLLVVGALYAVVHAVVQAVFPDYGILTGLTNIFDLLLAVLISVGAVAAIICVIAIGVQTGRRELEERAATQASAPTLGATAAGRRDFRQASVDQLDALRRQSLVCGTAVLAYWVVRALVLSTLARVGISGGLGDLLTILLGVLGLVSLIPIFWSFAIHGGLIGVREHWRTAAGILVAALLVIVLGLPVARFAAAWGSSTPPPTVPVVVPTPTPTPPPTNRPNASQEPGITQPPTNGSQPPASPVTTANQAASVFGGAPDRWDNIGEMWILSKGKGAHLTVPEGWAATYVDNVGGSHGCTGSDDWAQGPQNITAVTAVLLPSVDAACALGG